MLVEGFGRGVPAKGLGGPVVEGGCDGPDLLATQTCLRLKEFWQLVDCSLSEGDWDALVRERCRGGRDPYLTYMTG